MAKEKNHKVEETVSASNPQPDEIVKGAQPVDNSVSDTSESEPIVEVKASQLESILDQLKTLKESNDALEKTVSKTRLDEAKAESGFDKRSRVHFKVMEGKVIIGWPSGVGPDKKNEIIFNPATNMPIGEIVKSVYYFADDTKTELIDQIRFVRLTELAFARVVSEDEEYGLLDFEDKALVPEPIKIHKRFWNA